MPCVSTGSKSYLGNLSLHAKQTLLHPVYEVVLLHRLEFHPFYLKNILVALLFVNAKVSILNEGQGSCMGLICCTFICLCVRNKCGDWLVRRQGAVKTAVHQHFFYISLQLSSPTAQEFPIVTT